MEAFGQHELLPIYLHTFLGPIPRPRSKHLFGGSIARTLHELHAPAQGLLNPIATLVLSSVARVQPQMMQAREALLRSMQQRLDPLSKSITLALWTFAFSTKPSVSTRMWRLRPFTFFPPS